MDLRYIQINAAMLVGDYDHARLIAFLRREIKRSSARLDYWIRELEADRVAGMHAWNNLATIISMASSYYGFNAVQPIAYCVNNAQRSAPPQIIVNADPIARWQAQLSD